MVSNEGRRTLVRRIRAPCPSLEILLHDPMHNDLATRGADGSPRTLQNWVSPMVGRIPEFKQYPTLHPLCSSARQQLLFQFYIPSPSLLWNNLTTPVDCLRFSAVVQNVPASDARATHEHLFVCRRSPCLNSSVLPELRRSPEAQCQTHSVFTRLGHLEMHTPIPHCE